MKALSFDAAAPKEKPFRPGAQLQNYRRRRR